MIGTKFLLGFDAKAVQKGLSGIGGMLGRFSKQIGIGMARQVGARMTDTVGRLLSYIPEAANDLIDYAGGMNDMAAQTGMTTKELMVMEEAFRGVTDGGVDAGRMIATMRDNLYSASTGAGAARDALHLLGIGAQDLIGLKPAEQIAAIGEALNTIGVDNPAFESIVKDLFGGRIGVKGLGLMKDFSTSMKNAEKIVGSFGDESMKTFKVYDEIGELFGQWTMIRRELMASMMQGAFGKELENGLTISEAIVSSLKSLKPIFEGIGGMLGPVMKLFADTVKSMNELGVGGYFQNVFDGIKAGLSEAISQGIKDALNPFSGMFGDKGKSSMNSNNPLIKETVAQTNILERIYRDKVTAQFS